MFGMEMALELLTVPGRISLFEKNTNLQRFMGFKFFITGRKCF